MPILNTMLDQITILYTINDHGIKSFMEILSTCCCGRVSRREHGDPQIEELNIGEASEPEGRGTGESGRTLISMNDQTTLPTSLKLTHYSDMPPLGGSRAPLHLSFPTCIITGKRLVPHN